MHNHTCGCGHHEGDAGCGSHEHDHGEVCACGAHHVSPEVEPLASAWSMLGKTSKEQTVPPTREFDEFFLICLHERTPFPVKLPFRFYRTKQAKQTSFRLLYIVVYCWYTLPQLTLRKRFPLLFFRQDSLIFLEIPECKQNEKRECQM